MDEHVSRGFTLIELLIVITLLGVLSSVVLSVVNFNKQMGDSRNMTRRIDLHTIAIGVMAYTADTGDFPNTISSEPGEICRTLATDCIGLVDLSMLTTNSKYLIKIPYDKLSEGNTTGYRIYRAANGRVVVSAPLAENGEALTVVR